MRPRPKNYETETETSPVKSIACVSNTHEVNDEPEMDLAFKMVSK